MNADSDPIPVDLAREADFSVAHLNVRPSLRQVESGETSETLEPRVMQVLVALAQRRGEVVSRDELILRCWGGRVVGEDAISRVIARVRKLGDANGAFALETIARVGYRLLPAAGASTQPNTEVPATHVTAAARPALLSRPAVWLMAGAAAVLVVAVTILARPSGPDVDSVVARLSERLQEQPGSKDVNQVSDAVRHLGRSGDAREKSAFEALASDDGVHALDVLDDLARQLEASGDTKAAANAYGRLGAIAVLFDSGRAVAAQRRAFELDPHSLRTFQSSFFIGFLKGTSDSLSFTESVLANPRLTEQMRGWVLSHRAFLEAGSPETTESAMRTIDSIKALPTFNRDPVLQASALWVQSVMSYNQNDVQSTYELARQATELWSRIPERTSNSPEPQMIRALYELGDWDAAFELGTAALNRRTREGDLLPVFLVWTMCEAGLVTGRLQDALAFCQSSVRRREGNPAMMKGHAALAAFIEGNTELAAREIEAAHALVPPAGSIPAVILTYEALIAEGSGDLARAEALLASQPGGRTWEEATRYRPTVHAMANRLLGSWLIKAGEPRRACEPLAKASRAYASYRAAQGVSAVAALEKVAGCPPR
jgi:DNA-binding winged helix-turn-helix (wHTH) protein